MPCLKDEPIFDSPSSVPTPNSIPVEVEVTFEPSLESPQEPETNPELSASPRSTLDPPSIPETLDPVLKGFDEEEEHPEVHAQALRDYQLVRAQSIFNAMMNPWASNQDRWLKFEWVRDAGAGHPGLPVVTLDVFMFSLPPQFKRHSRLFYSSLFFYSFSAFPRAVSVSSSSPLLYRGLPHLLLSSSDLRVPRRGRHFNIATRTRRVSLYTAGGSDTTAKVIVFNFGLVNWLEPAVK
ncbi:hypothetical protein M9H77_11550 [Catharanthus roseus]|uniref:Uncharacterized protein n=1 Tax=Catharanthus roseus TaxID=4058 RepID=A0ACC0BEY2_CATRO|nr:hypothetical protein M9H77_11550 [Catharanthus roseus]